MEKYWPLSTALSADKYWPHCTAQSWCSWDWAWTPWQQATTALPVGGAPPDTSSPCVCNNDCHWHRYHHYSMWRRGHTKVTSLVKKQWDDSTPLHPHPHPQQALTKPSATNQMHFFSYLLISNYWGSVLFQKADSNQVQIHKKVVHVYMTHVMYMHRLKYMCAHTHIHTHI